ncbi:radical SAM protein [Thalassobaculum sp.]|uniref:B12-binding domain-containing radical SAM protein n=1 Tax=Thalassobaculum sp. TaxID=2022740 RepID=UPI0032EFC828
MVQRSRFTFVMIKPSHYDDDGYVIQWAKSAIPSNTLAALYGIAEDCARRQVLGPNVDLDLVPIDETNTRVRPERIAARIRRNRGGGLIGLVGVQSNQYPRALDLARRFRALGCQVCIGGFHVSGTLSMLPGIQPELQEALDMGVSLFAGEAEGRLDDVLQDAQSTALKPIYNYMNDLPGMEGTPVPILPRERIGRTAGRHTSFDSGRGCPFQCSFCTIINVQGRKSRFRSADDIERIVRANVAQGVNRFFITDDNFARNRNWEPIFDRLIELREGEGFDVKYIIQVDTLCHKIPNFIEKAGRAGVKRVFIGLENINPENLAAASKRQNRITEYRKMLQAWRSIGVLTYAGYILGFPADTPEKIRRDIEIIQRELPIDLLEFFYLTPLPGSADHKALFENGVAMDADLNRYDLNHSTTGHATMSRAELEQAYRDAWETYYSPGHVETILRRARASGISVGNTLFLCLWFYCCVTLENIHPLEGGWWRKKVRTDRRPGLPIENPVAFHLRYWGGQISKHWTMLEMVLRYGRLRRQIKADPQSRSYSDLSLEPVRDEEMDSLDMYTLSQSAQNAVSKARRDAAASAAARARAGTG